MSDWIVRGLSARFVRNESTKRAAAMMVAAGYRGEQFVVTILPRPRWWYRFDKLPEQASDE